MTSNHRENKNRAELSAKVAEFLEAGGEIQEIPRGRSGQPLTVRKDKRGQIRIHTKATKGRGPK